MNNNNYNWTRLHSSRFDNMNINLDDTKPIFEPYCPTYDDKKAYYANDVDVIVVFTDNDDYSTTFITSPEQIVQNYDSTLQELANVKASFNNPTFGLSINNRIKLFIQVPLKESGFVSSGYPRIFYYAANMVKEIKVIEELTSSSLVYLRLRSVHLHNSSNNKPFFDRAVKYLRNTIVLAMHSNGVIRLGEGVYLNASDSFLPLISTNVPSHKYECYLGDDKSGLYFDFIHGWHDDINMFKYIEDLQVPGFATSNSSLDDNMVRLAIKLDVTKLNGAELPYTNPALITLRANGDRLINCTVIHLAYAEERSMLYLTFEDKFHSFGSLKQNVVNGAVEMIGEAMDIDIHADLRPVYDIVCIVSDSESVFYKTIKANEIIFRFKPEDFISVDIIISKMRKYFREFAIGDIKILYPSEMYVEAMQQKKVLEFSYSLEHEDCLIGGLNVTLEKYQEYKIDKE